VTPPRRNKSRGKQSLGPRGAGSAETDERRYHRKILDQPQWLECQGVGCELRGHISVVGLGGVFIRTLHLFPVGSALGLRIRKGKEWLEAVCVVRSTEDNGMGVEFMPPRARLSPHLSELIGESKR
jgi:hypothetical protein